MQRVRPETIHFLTFGLLGAMLFFACLGSQIYEPNRRADLSVFASTPSASDTRSGWRMNEVRNGECEYMTGETMLKI